MTQKDKELLLIVLSAMLPYGVKGIITYNGDKDIFTIKGIFNILFLSDTECCHVEDFKPYLRPMSSMTEEERKGIGILIRENRPSPYGIINNEGVDNLFFSVSVTSTVLIDWLNKNHFDYRGLIPKGLAIEVTSENNPYK